MAKARKKFRFAAALIIAAVVTISAMGRISRARADDDDDEKPITSASAQVTRNEAGRVFISIRPAAAKEIGLATETLEAITRPIDVAAYGVVLDPGPLANLNGELTTTRAALSASKAEFQRARRLYREHMNVSQKAMQTAQAAYASNEARLDVLRQQLSDDWGGEIAQMKPQALSDFVAALIARQKAIARVSLPAGEILGHVPHQARVVILGRAEEPLIASAVYQAPNVNSRMQGESFLLWIGSSPSIALPGMAVTAYMPTTKKSARGVLVPRSAVVRYEGRAWVYQEMRRDRFTRRRLDVAESTRNGYFVTAILRPGMQIVVTGAQMLLSEELRSQIQLGD